MYNQVNQEQILTACSRAPVFEYVAPTPVTEHIAPAPAVTSDAHSQQLPPVYTITTGTTDVTLDIIGLVYPQFSSTAVEPFSPQVVGSFSPLEFDAPMSCCARKVTVQEIPQVSVVERIQELYSFTGLMNPQISATSLEAPQVVGSLPPFEEFTESVYNQVHQEQIVAGEMTQEHKCAFSCARTGDRSRNSSGC